MTSKNLPVKRRESYLPSKAKAKGGRKPPKVKELTVDELIAKARESEGEEPREEDPDLQELKEKICILGTYADGLVQAWAAAKNVKAQVFFRVVLSKP